MTFMDFFEFGWAMFGLFQIGALLYLSFRRPSRNVPVGDLTLTWWCRLMFFASAVWLMYAMYVTFGVPGRDD